jgi:hypothetical protein
MGDAAFVAWNAKYIYNFWRPITAIRLANTDSNPATTADPTWTPEFYGADNIHFTIGSHELPGVARSFNSFSAAAGENAWSRAWLGVHYSFDSTEGLAVGGKRGNNIYNEIMGPARRSPAGRSR